MASAEGVSMADPDEDPTAAVEEPAKVMRIGMMLKQLLEEVKAAPLDEAARDRLAEVHARSVAELRTGLSEDLAAELDRITLPFSDDAAPSDAELRVAQAQLVGWLEGLFHGIQTALVAQQMMAQNQLATMRRALPPGMTLPVHGRLGQQSGQGGQGGQAEQSGQGQDRPGQYL
nr:bacterial proteasome activator family protein [Pseudactinotalea sp. HY158]